MDLIFKAIAEGMWPGWILAGGLALLAGALRFEMLLEARRMFRWHPAPVGSPVRPVARSRAMRGSVPIPAGSGRTGPLRGRLRCPQTHFPCLVRE